MRRLTHAAAYFFARLQQRFCRARSGSVLILVVALLVILALIGTAWMTSARNDRYSSSQNIANTQIDLLVEGAIALVEGVLADDLFSSGGYRLSGTGEYENWDASNLPTAGVGVASDDWLADRIPRLEDPSVVMSASNRPTWWAISAPLDKSGEFNDPRQEPTIPFAVGPKDKFEPTWLEYPAGSGKFLPAFGNYIAADADGDGIADAVLWKLLDSPIDGVTYYVAYRIIDNSSAVNASIAWAPNDTPGAGTLAGNYFPTNINLQALLYDAGGSDTPDQQIDRLNEYRFNNVTPTDPVADGGGTPTVRADFDYQDYYEALWLQLGRRLNNPGWVDTASRFRAPTIGDQIMLAYHFCLVNPSSIATESFDDPLRVSIYDNVPNMAGLLPSNQAFYPEPSATMPDPVGNWFEDNFDYDNPSGNGNPLDVANEIPRRALLTLRNAVSNVNVAPLTAAAPHTGMNDSSMRAAINNTHSASFGLLWRKFFDVMDAGPNASPFSTNLFNPSTTYDGNTFTVGTFANNTTEHEHRMFRSSIRDPRTPTYGAYFQPYHQLILRAAIAAVNTIDLIDSDNDVTRKNITLPAVLDGNPLNAVDVNVAIYGTENQCYITEVFANTNTSTPGGSLNLQNLQGYIAIELHNPHTGDDIDLTGWKLAIVTRPSTATYPLVYTELVSDLAALFPTAVTGQLPVLPAGGHLVLENYQHADITPRDVNAAGYRPPSQNLPPNESSGLVNDDPWTLYVPDLHLALNQELVLLRPIDEGAVVAGLNLPELAPIDQYDFTGLELPTGSSARIWHYVRPNGTSAAWKCIYPGRYDANQTTAGEPRNQGTATESWDPAIETDPWDVASGGTAPSTPVQLKGGDSGARYSPTFTIQLTPGGWAGPSHPGGTNNVFPFGTFARNGDLLQVPFIGSYIVETAAAGLVEMNGVSMDSAFADDTDLDNDEEEQIGRFCPFYWENPVGTVVTNDFGSTAADFRYEWARDLFDHFSVIAPHDDFFPNVSPTKYAAGGGTPEPEAVANSPGDAGNSDPTDTLGAVNDDIENDEAIHGLININTAPWPVLATLPMVIDITTGTVDLANNIALAMEIVNFRDVDSDPVTAGNQPHGPFASIFDLQRVPGFRDAMGTFDPATFQADDMHGDISPLNTAGTNPDDVVGDFETKYLVLNRISNLITTRSDSFTAYIVVQGWRNAESTDPLNPPELVVQRRVGAIIDRSGVVSDTTKGNLSTTRFPQN